MTFEVIHGNQRLIESEREAFRIADAYQQSSRETGALRDRNSVDRVITALSIAQRLPDHRHNSAQMLARGQFGHNSAVRLMSCNLGGDNVRDQLLARTHYGCRGLITGAFDAEDIGVGHSSILMQGCGLACGYSRERLCLHALASATCGCT